MELFAKLKLFLASISRPLIVLLLPRERERERETERAKGDLARVFNYAESAMDAGRTRVICMQNALTHSSALCCLGESPISFSENECR